MQRCQSCQNKTFLSNQEFDMKSQLLAIYFCVADLTGTPNAS